MKPTKQQESLIVEHHSSYYKCVHCGAQHMELIDVETDMQDHPIYATFACGSCGYHQLDRLNIPYCGKGA